MATPQTVDLFSRYFAEMYDEKQIISVPTAGQAFFGRPGSETVLSPDANAVDIDIVRGNERIAALVPRGTVSRPLGSNQKNMNVEKFTSFSRKYPLAEEEGDINAHQLEFRIAGENPYEPMNRFNRMRMLGEKIIHESIRRIIRLDEVLAWQSLLDGTQDAILGTSNTDMQYDFRRQASHIITVTNAWDSGSQTILSDIDDAADLVRADGHMNADMIVMGGDAFGAFLNDSDVQGIADNRRYFEEIMVRTGASVPQRFQRFVDSGMDARGKIVTPKGRTMWVFTYDDVYVNSAGTATEYMPTDHALVCSSMARADRYFGPPEQLPMIPQREQLYMQLFGFNPQMPPMPNKLMSASGVVEPASFYHDAYVTNDWKKVTIRTQHAPIFATTATDGFVTLDGLIT